MGLNAIIDRLLAGRNARKTAKLVAFCSDNILYGTGLTVLDLGCGNGLFCHALSELSLVSYAVGADVVDYRKESIDFQLHKEGEAIPFDDKSFDYTFIVEVLHHSDDPEHLLMEAVRVTRGSVVVFEDVVTSSIRLFFMRGFDILMNMRHGVNTPLNFKSEREWEQIFSRLNVSVQDIYDYSFYTMYSPQRCRVFILRVCPDATLRGKGNSAPDKSIDKRL